MPRLRLAPRSVAAALAAVLAACGDGDPPRRAPTSAAPAVPGATARDAAGRVGPATIGPHPLREFVVAHDAFLSIDDPRGVPAAQARFLRDDDEVFGVVVAEKARAYAIAMLAYHHVINDVMAGTPVAVTY
ncbi:MAG: DUF3179 domain-containing protein [Planctomycetes bacterium]|nr:DUF3179 domain-containing protein [Planctomycetota bacterium]